jgi:hypothetical protein
VQLSKSSLFNSRSMVMTDSMPVISHSMDKSCVSASSDKEVDHSCIDDNHNKNNNNNNNSNMQTCVEDTDSGIDEYWLWDARMGPSFWTVLFSLHLTLVGLCGMAGIVRPILLGHVLRVCLPLLHTPPPQWIARIPGWSSVTSILTTDKNDPRVWPPPTLVLLAILTITTMLVHPDGLTWILLRKLR